MTKRQRVVRVVSLGLALVALWMVLILAVSVLFFIPMVPVMFLWGFQGMRSIDTQIGNPSFCKTDRYHPPA